MLVLFLALLSVDLNGWEESFSSGEWQVSYDLAVEALASDSSSAEAWAALAFSAGATGRVFSAADYAATALELDSSSAMAWAALGASGDGDMEDSMDRFDRALRLDPGFVPAIVGMAHCLMTAEQDEAALRELDKALAVDPEWISIWLKMSEIHCYRQEFEKAFQSMNGALVLWPRNRELLMETAWLSEMTGRYRAAEDIYWKVAEAHPDDTGSLTELGMMLEHLGRFGEAVKVYREIGRRDPENYWCLGETGICLETLGDTLGARESYLEGIRVNPEYSFAYYRLGLLAEAEEDTRSAMENYRLSVEAAPSFAEGWVAMGLLYEDELDYTSAEMMYRKAVEADPGYAWAWGELALVLEQLGSTEEAEEAYQQGIAADSSYAWAWEQRGLLLEDSGDLEGAARWYGRAVGTLDEPGVWLLGELGYVLEQLGRDDSASVYYSRALSVDSSYMFGLQRLAGILTRQGEYSGALEIWDTYTEAGGYRGTALAAQTMIFEELGMDDTADSLRRMLSEEYPYAWIDLAWDHMHAEPEVSLELARRAEEEASGDDPEYWALLAGLFAELDRTSEAERSYAAATRLAPDSADIWIDWGYFLFQRDRDDEAAEKYRRATELDSLSFSAWGGLGEALLFAGRYDRALEALERCLELDPSSAWIYAYMGLAWERKGDSNRAMDHYFQALSLSPGYDYAEARIRDITGPGYDPDWHRRKSRPFTASLYVDTRVDNGNIRERDYSGGFEVSLQYDPEGSEVSLEADHRLRETSRDYAGDYSWSMITGSIERVLSDDFTVTASSSWDRQPGTVRPWQISSYLSFGYRKWMLDWLWFSPSLGIGQVNTHWASGLDNERTDRTTFYGSLSLWFSDEDSPFPSLWLWGNFYLPPENPENMLMNGLAELTLEMWDPLSLTLGYSAGYTRTPAYDFWEKYDTEFYSRLNFRVF